MKTDELYMTIEELDELCRLYMDCNLSVLEEKELEYILSQTTLTSPAIEEVRSLMRITAFNQRHVSPRKFNFRIWKYVSGIAASLAVVFSVGCYLFSPQSSGLTHTDSSVYITAYSHGERLSDKAAITATNSAMEKADSLINLALLTEREYIHKANDIINETNFN